MKKCMTTGILENSSLPQMKVIITRKMIVMGATSSRDWQPIHHDCEYAREHAALPDIIMNNYTQAGWLSRYITDWFGSGARLARMKFSMITPLCPGDEAEFSAEIQSRSERQGFMYIDVAAKILVGERLATKANIGVALPMEDGGESPWECAESDWPL